MPANTSDIAQRLVGALRDAAASASNETELRIKFEPELKAAIADSDWDLEYTPRHEKALASGFADSVFGQAVIEFKSPGRMSADLEGPGNCEARQELVRYLTDQAEGSVEALKRSVGIALDGRYIFFLRWRDGGGESAPPGPQPPLTAELEAEASGGWQIEGPYEISEQSVVQMLHYLRALVRKRLTPEALRDDFGPHTVTARMVVNTLYDAFTSTDDPKVRVLFDQWDRIFGIVYGEDLDAALRDADELAEAYEVEGEVRLKPLLFSVHTYFALFIKLIIAELMSQRDPTRPSFVGGLAGGIDGRVTENLQGA